MILYICWDLCTIVNEGFKAHTINFEAKRSDCKWDNCLFWI